MATCIHSSRSCLLPFYTIPIFPLLNRKIFHLLVHNINRQACTVDWMYNMYIYACVHIHAYVHACICIHTCSAELDKAPSLDMLWMPMRDTPNPELLLRATSRGCAGILDDLLKKWPDQVSHTRTAHTYIHVNKTHFIILS